MKRPCLYHFYNEEGSVMVRDLRGTGSTARAAYSLKKEMDRVRREGIGKGIILDTREHVGELPSTRKLWAVVIGKSPKHKVLFTGCHHAREWISVEMPFLLAEYLVHEYPTGTPTTEHQKRIKYLVDNRQIWIVPMVNPDGHERTRVENRVWRGTTTIHPVFKTKTFWAPKLGGGGRTVIVPPGFYSNLDPNRNYKTTDWGHETYISPTQRATSRDPADVDAWCGFEAESEAETKAIADLIKREKFRAGMTYHNYSQLLMYARRTKDDAFVQFVGKGLHQLINEHHNPYTYQGLDALYPTTGNEVDYHLDKVPKRPVYVTELRPGPGSTLEHSELPEAEIEPCFHENLPAMLALICCAGFDAPTKKHTSEKGAPGVKDQKLPVIPNCWKVFEGWVP